MALKNPGGIYQGQAKLNPLPYLNIALQSRARKQAKEEAIDKYYQNLPNTINDKGVRDQEIPVINDYKNKIFEFGLKNKEALRNPKLDNGAAQFELQKLMRGAETVARLSMDAAKDDLEVGKIRLQKGNEWLVDDDEFMKDNELQNLPVTDPRFKKIDINKVLQGRPFDLSKKVKNYADIKMGEGEPMITPHPQDPLLEIVKTNPVFDEETKKTLYARAVNDYHNDKSFEKQINKITSPEEIAELNEISQRTFGHPIREDFEGEDAAAAFMVRALAPKPTVQKIRPNVKAAFDYKRKAGMADFKIKENIKQAGRRELLGMREDAKKAGEEADNLWVDRYLGQIYEDSKKAGSYQTYTPVGGKSFNGYIVQQDPVISKAVGFDDKNKGTILVTDDGKWVIAHYKTDANYEPIIKDGKYVVEKSSILNQDAIKLALGGKAGVKQLNKEMVKPSPKTKPKKDPLGLF